MKPTLVLALFAAGSLAAGCLAAGCGGPFRPAGGETVAADTAATPTLSFAADWSITQSAPVVGGANAIIHYDPARLPNCRAVYHGFPAWGISAYYAVDGGQAFTAPVTSFQNGTVVPVDATIVVPPGRDLAIWFSNSDEYGCSQWDSSYGNNFHFAITDGAPTLHFRWPDWSEEQSAPLVAGGDVLVDYDIRRLPNCRQDYNGLQSWDVVAWYRFDGGAAPGQPMSVSVTTEPTPYQRVQAPARISTPTGASTMDVWFENDDRTGCDTWDSAYGANYHFVFDR